MKYHDLSFDESKINYPTLLEVVTGAVAMVREEINRKIQKSYSKYGQTVRQQYDTDATMDAEGLIEDAQFYAKAVETAHLLVELPQRSQINWLNKPNWLK